MPTPIRKRNRQVLFATGSLTAIGEIMLVLWITSIMVNTTVQVQMAEAPLANAGGSPGPSPAFAHSILVGPGQSLALDGQSMPLAEITAALGAESGGEIELRAAENVDAVFFFNCRYQLRQAGIGYTERPPAPANKPTTTEKSP